MAAPRAAASDISDAELNGIEAPDLLRDDEHLSQAEDSEAMESKAKDSQEPRQLKTPNRTPTPHLAPLQQLNEDTDSDQQSAPSGGDRRGGARDTATSGNLPHNARWEFTNEPPRQEITSENVPILQTRTRRGGGTSGRTFYTTLETPSQWNDSLYAFITSTKQHRNTLPPPPETYDQAKKHQFWPQWQEAMAVEMNDIQARNVYKLISYTTNISPKPIPLKWVFSYKFDGNGFLQRFKARICVRGDKQPLNGLDTYAATLAAESMRFLLALAAYFDLEMRQYDAITAFLNAELDETIYTTPPPGSNQKGQLWLLQKALYGLRRSPHLWHNEISRFLQNLGLYPIPGVNCIHHNDWLIVFFFIDDIICLYRKEHQEQFNTFEAQISSKYKLRIMGEPEYFLGIKIERNRARRSITLSHSAYINKITARFEQSLLPRTVHTPLPTKKLVPNYRQATQPQIKEMQQKVGSINYSAVILRPDIALAASMLAEFLINPSPQHLHAANHCLSYLRDTRLLSIT